MMRNGKQSLLAGVLALFFLASCTGVALAGKPCNISVPGDYPTIQAAIDAANPVGCTITVSDGIYTESINFGNKDIHVLSVNGPGATTIDGAGAPRTVSIIGEPASFVSPELRGFTITGAVGECGIFISGNYGSNPVIDDCVITGNNGSGIIQGCGAGLISNCVITNNVAGATGGGIVSGGEIRIEDCVIANNSTTGVGGGIRWTGSFWGYIKNCVITNNSAGGNGGGIVFDYLNSGFVANCAITNNSAGGRGGGIFIATGHNTNASYIRNCTLSGNTSLDGGGIYSQGLYGAEYVVNSILYFNLPNEISGDATLSFVQVTYSDIQGGYPGAGNINVDPLFVADRCGKSNYETDQPLCIDAGDPANAPADDLCGATRDSMPDMGAYEVVPCAIQITKAAYDYVTDILQVEATSPYGQDALLELVGYVPPEMTWDNRNGIWTKTVTGVTAPPVDVTVYGPVDSCETTVD